MDALWDALWRPLVYAVLAGGVFIPLERQWPARDQGSFRLGWHTDALFATVGSALAHLGLALTTGLGLAAIARVTWFDLGLRGISALLVGFLVFELAGYAYHRAAHASPILWRFHGVHHSASRMDWLASFRQHPVEMVAMTLVQNIPLVLLGVPIGAHAGIVGFIMLWSALVHANLRCEVPGLREVLATPAFHHRHHDRHGHAANFAALFPVLDRLFGTFAEDRAVEFGVEERMPAGFWGLLGAPFVGRRG